MLENCCQGAGETYFTNCEHTCLFFVYLCPYLWCPTENDPVKDVNYGEIVLMCSVCKSINLIDFAKVINLVIGNVS